MHKCSLKHVWVVASCLCISAFGCDRLPESMTKGTAKGTDTKPPTVQLNDPGVLALVNGVAVMTSVFKERLDALPEDSPQGFMTAFGSTRLIHRKPRTAEERHVLLEELVKEELAVQDAVSLGLERSPEVKQRIEDARRLVLLDALAKRDMEGLSVTDQEIQEYYDRYKAAFKVPERIHVRQIVTPGSQEAESLRTQAIQGADFAQLAKDHSVGAGKDLGGDVGWYMKAVDQQILAYTGETKTANVFFPQLEPVAFALEVGQVSQPVKGPDKNYYIIKLEERVPERQKPISEIWEQLKTGLLVQKRQQTIQEHFDRLWKKGTIQINDRRLEQL